MSFLLTNKISQNGIILDYSSILHSVSEFNKWWLLARKPSLRRSIQFLTFIVFNRYSTFSLLLFGIHIASSQILGLGPCPNVQGVANFDLSKYTGEWYEVKKYPNFFTRNGKCVKATYKLLQDDTISVYDQQKTPNGLLAAAGIGRLLSSGVLGVSFQSQGC